MDIKTKENTIATFLRSPVGMTLIVIFIAVFLIIYLLFSIQPTRFSQNIPIPTPIAEKTQADAYLTTSPSLITASLSFINEQSSVAVLLNTGNTAISGGQLSISYNPATMTNVTIVPGTFFNNPVILQSNIDPIKGVINYAFSVQPTDQQKKGQGTIAIISFTRTSDAPTQVSFLPDTKITSEGVNASVLKKTTSITLP